MDSLTESALRAIEGAVESARKGPIFDAALLEALQRYENAPWNSEGTDKSWVWRCWRLAQDHFRKAKPVKE